MDYERTFGDAVHSVFPFMQNGGDPKDLTCESLHAELLKYPKAHAELAGNDIHFLNDVLKAWQKIASVAYAVDNFMIEPDFLGDRRIDLLLHRQHIIELLEVKSVIANGHRSTRRREAKLQLQATAWRLKELIPDVQMKATILWVDRTYAHIRFKMENVPLEK